MIEFELVQTLEGHEHPIYALCPSEKEHIFFSAGGEAAVVEWSLKKMQPIKVVYKSSGSIYFLHSVVEYPYLISGDRNGVLSIFDFNQQKLVYQQQVSSAAIFNIKNIGNQLYLINEKGELIHFNLDSFQKVETFSLSNQALRTMCIGHHTLYISGKDLVVYEFDLKSQNISKKISDHTLPVFSSIYDLEDQILYTGSRDAHIKKWNEHELIKSIPAHYFAVNDLQFNNSKEYIISASMDKTIKVWSKELELLAIADASKNKGHMKSVNRLAISKYEDFIMSASDDRNILVWKIIKV